MKKSNVMGAAALFLGIVLAVATSAFKPAKTAQENSATLYGRLSTGEWVNIEDDPSRLCNESTEVCKAYFESQPAQNAVPDSEDIVEDNGTLQ